METYKSIGLTVLTFKEHPRNQIDWGLLSIKWSDKVVFNRYEKKETLNQYDFKTKKKVCLPVEEKHCSKGILNKGYFELVYFRCFDIAILSCSMLSMM